MNMVCSFWPVAAPRAKMRCVRNHIRDLGRALALGLALTAPVASPAQPAQTELTLPQARQLAHAALAAGDTGLTLTLARGLLLADPGDSGAHLLIARAQAAQNRPGAARQAAARAYRSSDDPALRFQAAQLAARMSLAEDRPTLAQVWLRRTSIHAPNEQVEQMVARDYRVLRVQNPFAFRLRSDLRPSNNVNNGSDTALQIIDGVPVTGVLGGAARALSGAIGALDGTTSYRLSANDHSATTISGRLYLQRVALSSQAKAQAPTVSGSDFGATVAELSLRRAFALGDAPGRGSAGVEGSLGESWSGKSRAYRFGRIDLDRHWRLDAATSLRLSLLAERRFHAGSASNDARVFGLVAELGRALDNGDRLSLGLAYRDTRAQAHNGTFTAASARLSYAFAKAVGPARLSAGLTLGQSDYPVFRSGLFMVPGGRRDQSVYGDVSLFFDRYDYAGFAPTLRLRSGRKQSNDSRFTTREVSVSVGVELKF